MSARIRSMTSGSPMKLLITFALPLMLGNVFQQLYTVVDTMIVGRGVGVQALAALGAGDWLGWLSLGTMQGLTQGFGIPMAQAFGAGDEEKLKQVVGASVLLAALSAVGLFLFDQFLAIPLLNLLKTPPEIMPLALLYLRIIYCGVPVVMAYNLLATILRSLGDSQTPLHAMIVACAVNIGLDLLFVLVFHWGIAGAAIATVIAQGCSGVFCLLRLRKITILKLDRTHLRLDRKMAFNLLRLGLPTAAMNMIIAAGGMLIQMVVNGFGVLFIAGFTASNKMYGVLEIAATSYGFAVTTYVGQNLGAERMDRIKNGVGAACVIAVLTSLVIMTVMLVFGRSILSLFLSGTPQEISKTLEIAYGYLTVMSVCLPFLYLLFVFRSAIQGMGNTFLPMLSGIMELTARLAAGLTLPGLMGEHGIFYAEVLAWISAVVLLVPGYVATYRKESRKRRCVKAP